MKTTLIVAVVLLWSTHCIAETRIIAVQITRATNAEIRVSIHSDEKEENKTDLTIEQANTILQNAKGWGSTVLVGVIAHDVPLREYLPLLKTISENVWFQLALVEGEGPDFIRENIRKMIEPGH